MRSAVVFLVVVVAVVACSSPSRPSPSFPKTAATTTPRAPSLLDHVPDDTPFVLSQTGSSFAGAQLHNTLMTIRQELEPALASVDDEAVASGEPGERLLLVALRAILALDTDDLARLGLDPARMELAFYGWGLTPVMRLRLDGPFLRALVDRTFKDAGIEDPALAWGKHQYRTYTLESGMQLIAVVLDDQLVLAMSRRAEKILPHMVGDEAGRPARPFELATIAKRYPQLEGTPTMFFDPGRTAALLESGDELRTLMPEPPPRCGRALAGIARSFPGLAATLSEPDRRTRKSQIVIGPSLALAETVGAAIRPIPRWPAEPPGPHVAYYGVGVAPLPILEAIAGYFDDIGAAAHACGGKPPSESARDSLRAVASMLAPIHGMTIVFHASPDKDDESFQVEMYADVTDPYAIYGWLRPQLGLPSRPPALDTPTELPLGFMPATLVLETRAIAASMGRNDAAALEKLRRAPRGPRLVARVEMGVGTAEESPDSTTFMELRVVDDALVWDIVERTP